MSKAPRQRPIAIGQLIEALDAAHKKTHGKTYEQIIAMMSVKLIEDMLRDINVREAVAFTSTLMRYTCEVPKSHIDVESSIVEMTPIERQERIDNLLTRLELSKPLVDIAVKE